MNLRAVAVLAGTVSAIAAATAGAAGADEIVQFSTPSKNIGCVYAYLTASPGAHAFPASLRCDIGSGLRPKPAKPRGCNLDWGNSLSMNRTGRVHVTCHGDTALGSLNVLGYGQTWRHNGFTCVSRVAGLTCRNLSGHGFFLSRERSRIF